LEEIAMHGQKLRSPGFIVSAFLALVGLPNAGVQAAEEVKILLENAKVRVVDVTYRPGESSELRERPYRIVRALTDGSLERTTSDGKHEVVQWKAGDVKDYGPENSSSKNIGSKDFSVYVVIPK
jgi:hypothetical protein